MSESIDTATGVPKPGFFKEHLLPLLLIFLIPGFSLWFFERAESQLDQQVRDELRAGIKKERGLSDADRNAALEFYGKTPVSEVMASSSPEAVHLQEMFEPVKGRYAIFRWAKRVSMACLGSSLFAFAFVGLSVFYSLRSQAAQYRALRIGWPVLRGIAIFQVVGQGLLAVAMSYWVTVLWFEIYVPKLILIAAVLAFGGIVLIVKAMFAKPDARFEQMGEPIPEENAPGLWARVREIATALGTAPPDHIVGGIDASFFVTEHDLWLGDEKLGGRTLFVSLPLLKLLTVEEADAVLGHEMAHFSGDDTLWARRISPLLQNMAVYLGHLSAGGLTAPVFHFLHFFWKLYQYSLGRMSRSREFRADRIGARTASPLSLANALVKISAYCQYRGKTEEGVMTQRELDGDIGLAGRLDQGFPAFLSEFAADPGSSLAETPHPFDTHPPISARVEEQGLSPAEVLASHAVHVPVDRSWRDAVADASAIEQRLWTKREQMMKDVHEFNRAWTLFPRTEEELAVVSKFFPRLTFENDKGETAILDHESIALSKWPRPVSFSAIEAIELKESMGKKLVHLKFRCPEAGGTGKLKFAPEKFRCEDGNLLDALGHYYGRHTTARENSSGGESPDEG